MYTNYSGLNCLVNNPLLGGRICRWLLLLQEYVFEVVVEPGHLNVGPDHLSQIETSKELKILEDGLLNA